MGKTSKKYVSQVLRAHVDMDSAWRHFRCAIFDTFARAIVGNPTNLIYSVQREKQVQMVTTHQNEKWEQIEAINWRSLRASLIFETDVRAHDFYTWNWTYDVNAGKTIALELNCSSWSNCSKNANAVWYVRKHKYILVSMHWNGTASN